MLRWKHVWSTSAAVAAALAVSAPVYAQQVTANVRGIVTDANGAAVAGAEVAIIDTRTNFATNTSTSAGGAFAVSGLETGGPYEVVVTAPGFQTQRLEGLTLSIGDAASLAITLESADGATEEILVVRARDRVTKVAVGPNRVFDVETVELAPTITRDIRDVLRFDPRLIVSANAAGTQQNVSCLGGNNRSNGFTIDGVAQGDLFGLNASAFQNRFGNPYPFQATRQLSVEYAPFDVQYANFSGCAINAVTKSGSNEFHGSGFAEYTSDGLTGEQLEDLTLTRNLTRNFRWGADFSGRLIKDRVFFYVAYEEQDLGGNPVSLGPAGSGVGTPLNFVTPALVDSVRGQIQDVFGFDPGGIVSDLGFETRKILTHWTFVLSDKHKLDFTYNRFREANIQPDDGPSTQVFAFGGNFQTQGTASETYVARLTSQWTDKLSTEIRASRADVADLQDPLGGGEAQSGNPIPRIVIGVQPDAAFGTTGSGVLLAGPGFSRSANQLNTQLDQVRALVNYNTGRHNLTIGADWNQLSVFNLFVQNATGTLNFASLANFNALQPNILGTGTGAPNATNIADLTTSGLAGVFANGRGSDDISGAAASFGRTIFSGYLQDKWQPLENLTLTLGVRYDRYGGEAPPFNQGFLDRYGFDNSQTFQGLDLVQPRFALQYDIPQSLFGSSSITLGAGVFGGGDPAVWFSNVFSNTGGSFVTAQSAGPGVGTTTCNATQIASAFSGGQFVGLPQCIIDAQNAGLAGTLAGPVNAIDPNIELPSVVRANFEFKHTTDFNGFAGGFFDDWGVTVSYIHSAFRNAFIFFPLALAEVQNVGPGFTRLQTVDPLLATCGLDFAGIGQFTGTFTTGCNGAGSRNGDILLTNARGGNSDSLAFLAGKQFLFDIANAPSELNVDFGYAFTSARDLVSAQNSTATSGVTTSVITGSLFDRDQLAPGEFFTPHNLTFTVRSSTEFFKNLKTSMFAFFQARSGNAFSFTSQGGNLAPGLNSTSIYSLYIPSSPIAGVDPNVTFSSAFLNNRLPASAGNFAGLTGLEALNQFIADNNLEQFRGQVLPRNEFRDDWFIDLDLRFAQEIPTPIKGFKLEAYSTINNFLNLLTREGNIQRGFGDRASVVGLGNLPTLTNTNAGTTTPLVFDSFIPANAVQIVNPFQSLWQVSFGLRFEF